MGGSNSKTNNFTSFFLCGWHKRTASLNAACTNCCQIPNHRHGLGPPKTWVMDSSSSHLLSNPSLQENHGESWRRGSWRQQRCPQESEVKAAEEGNWSSVCSLGLVVNEGHFIHFGPDTLQIVQGKENSVSLGGRQPQKFSGAYRSKLLII